MTEQKLAAEYMRRERKAAATIRGQDVCAIIEEMAHEYGIDSAALTEIVLNHTIARAC